MVVGRAGDELVALERHAVGQDVVGVLAGIRHPDVDVDDELHLREDLVQPQAAVGAVVDGVAGDDPEGLDRVRLLRLDLLDELCLTQHLALVALAAVGHGDGGVVEDEREARGQHLGRDARTGAAEVAGEHAEQVERAVALALVLVAQAERAEDVGVGCRHVLVGELDGDLGGDAGDVLLPLGRVACRMLAQAREGGLAGNAVDDVRAVELHVLGRAVLAAHDHAHRSVGVEVPYHVVAVFVTQVHVVVVADEKRRDRVLEQELLVVLLALDDEVCHRHRKRRVGAGLDGDELVGKSCRAVEDQTDVDDLRAAAARLD